jgi:ribonucleotide monophosphatase NagD (HAD superfamily)
MICPGTFGEIYEKKGGKVLYFGKPHLDVYCSIYDDYF